MGNTAGQAQVQSSGGIILVQFSGKLTNAAKAEAFSLELKKLANKYGLGVVMASFSKDPASSKRGKNKK